MKIKPLALIASIALFSAAAPMALAADDNSGQQQDRSLGTVVDDATLTAKVKTKLIDDQRLDKTDIDVDTRNGVVTLKGTAPTSEAKQLAERLAKEVDGVKDVKNMLETPSAGSQLEDKAKSGAETTERVVSDSWITTKVKSELLADHTTKGLNIGVKTMSGTVSLTGEVKSQAEYDKAIQVAKDIKGVKDVDASGLKVKEGD